MFTWEDEFGNEHELRGKSVAVQAINEIRRGAYADAITTLEREFLPQWEDVSDCEGALAKHFAAALEIQVAAHVG